METQKLLDIIDDIIADLDNQLSLIINQANPDIDNKLVIYQNVYNHSNEPSILTELQINEDDFTPDDLKNLNYLKDYVKLFGSLDEEYQNNLKEILNRTIERLNEQLALITSGNNEQSIEIKNSISKYSNLKNKLLFVSELTEEDIDTIINLCIGKNMSYKEINDIINELTNNVIQKLYRDKNISHELEEELEQEIIEQNEEVLTDEELVEIFSGNDRKFKYDYNIFTPLQKDKLRKYGNLENIKEILNCFDDFNINFNVIYKDNPLLKTIKVSLTNILLTSNKGYVIQTLEIAKSHGLLDSDLVVLVQVLNNYSYFIPNKRISLGKHSGSISGQGSENDDIKGAFDNFKQNMKLIFQMYCDLMKNSTIGNLENVRYTDEDLIKGFAHNIFHKSSMFFTGSYQLHLNKIKFLDAYGIDKKQYLATLSLFLTKNISHKLDLFLELDCFDYIKDNLSRLIPQYYNIQHPQFVYLKKVFNLPNEIIFKPVENNVLKIHNNSKKLNYNRNNMYDIFVQNNLDPNNLPLVPKYQLSEEFKEKFKILSNVIDDEYYKQDETFFANLEDNLNRLEQSKDNLPFYKHLDDHYQDEDNRLIYRINGIAVSKYKVKRIYNIIIDHHLTDSFDCLFYALLKDSEYTQEQYDIILDELNKIKNKGVKF